MSFNDSIHLTVGRKIASPCPMSAFSISEPRDETVEVCLVRSMVNVPDCWDEAVPEDRVFLGKAYLEALENNSPKGMQFCYLMFHKDKQPIGVAACQIMHFNAGESLNEEGKGAENFVNSMGNSFREFVAKKVDFNTLICGNLLLTGEHGYYFDEKHIDKTEAFQVLINGLEKAKQTLDKEGIKISVTLLKDFFEKSKEQINPTLVANGFHEFSIQPNMIFPIRPEWNSFQDYLSAMTSKYRVRTKRALKKGAKIERKVLSVKEIAQNQEQLHQLYLNVVKSSGFNTATVPSSYFLSLKEQLGDSFQLTAYYIDGELSAFFTIVDAKEEIEAHFIGYDLSKNRAHQIYHNILLDIVKVGLGLQAKQIILARTALEIKSSVGAEAHEMYCYMKHRNAFSNRFLKYMFDYLNPVEEWKPRHPFK